MFEYGISEPEKRGSRRYSRPHRSCRRVSFSRSTNPTSTWAKCPQRHLDPEAARHEAVQSLRLSITTKTGKHYDLHIVMSNDHVSGRCPTPFTGWHRWPDSLWSVSGAFPWQQPTNLGILSTQYIGGLTAWDKIANTPRSINPPVLSDPLHGRNYLPAVSRSSSRPGTTAITRSFQGRCPTNVVVPEMDFRESAILVTCRVGRGTGTRFLLSARCCRISIARPPPLSLVQEGTADIMDL